MYKVVHNSTVVVVVVVVVDWLARFSVENAYLEEKEDVCNSLAEIAENVG